MRQAVRGYLDHLTVERGLSQHTLRSYRRDLERYLGTLVRCGVADLSQVGPAQITGHLAALRAGADEQPPLSSASTARAASAIR